MVRRSRVALAAQRNASMAKGGRVGRITGGMAYASQKGPISDGLSRGTSCGRRQKDGGPKGSGRAAAKSPLGTGLHARHALALPNRLMASSASSAFGAIRGHDDSFLMAVLCRKGREAAALVSISLAAESPHGAQMEKREVRRPRPTKGGHPASPLGAQRGVSGLAVAPHGPSITAAFAPLAFGAIGGQPKQH